MSNNSSIEWTEATWNPVVGCTWASAGCDHCYAATMTRRLEAMGKPDYAGLTSHKHFNGTVRCLPDKLEIPLRWKKPRRVFVNSMSDLFHKDVPFEFVDKVFAVMSATTWRLPLPQDATQAKPWHTYQVLTKRPERMAEYALSRALKFPPGEHPLFKVRDDVFRGHGLHLMNAAAVVSWPPPNIQLGTSIENHAAADERYEHLLKCPAAVRFLSLEPLLGAVELCTCAHNRLAGTLGHLPSCSLRSIHWVIAGCESRGGRVGRLLADHPGDEVKWWAAAQSIYEQCREAGVAFFCKQGPVNGRVCHDPAAWPIKLPRELPNTQESPR